MSYTNEHTKQLVCTDTAMTSKAFQVRVGIVGNFSTAMWNANNAKLCSFMCLNYEPVSCIKLRSSFRTISAPGSQAQSCRFVRPDYAESSPLRRVKKKLVWMLIGVLHQPQSAQWKLLAHEGYYVPGPGQVAGATERLRLTSAGKSFLQSPEAFAAQKRTTLGIATKSSNSRQWEAEWSVSRLLGLKHATKCGRDP